MNKEFWANKCVLVTGAGGFKGSHLVERLSETEAHIVSLVRAFNPRSYFHTQKLGEKSTMVVGDVKDWRKLADILSKYEITTVFHLAAQPIVPTAFLNPLETLDTNILGTVHVLEAARLFAKAVQIVIVSSDKAYEPGEPAPWRETQRLQGRTPYDVSKSCVDLISQVYADPNVYGMAVAIGRCANVFGPGDLNMSRIVPGTLEAIIRRHPLRLRSDGRSIREYIYVKDAVGGYLSLAENMNVTAGQAFNLASGHVLSVMQIVERIFSILGESIDVEILNEARGEAAEQRLDGSKIKDAIGWEATSDFAEAIRETYAWYRQVLAGPCVRASCAPQSAC